MVVSQLLRCMIRRIEEVSPYFAWDAPFTLNIYKLRPFSLVMWIFFRCVLHSVYCYTGVFDKYDDFARWGDEMEPKDTSGAKNPKLKKSWVTPLYLDLILLLCKRPRFGCGNQFYQWFQHHTLEVQAITH